MVRLLHPTWPSCIRRSQLLAGNLLADGCEAIDHEGTFRGSIVERQECEPIHRPPVALAVGEARALVREAASENVERVLRDHPHCSFATYLRRKLEEGREEDPTV